MNDSNFTLLTIDFDIDAEGEENSWNKLVDEILDGNVIPVIGSSLLYDAGDIHKILVDSLANSFKIKSSPSSFSELAYDMDFKKHTKDVPDAIYLCVNKYFGNVEYESSSVLKDLVSIKHFPFIITTSFMPIAEQAMRKVWGDQLRVMTFSNNSSKNSDIRSETDMRKPTIFYMFGRVGDAPHRYALTDTDMLNFCSSWVADTDRRPKTFVNNIKHKYLLMLGNNYSDWLFRFIWYSLRKPNEGGGLYTSVEEDDLSRFLQRNQTFLQRSPSEV